MNVQAMAATIGRDAVLYGEDICPLVRIIDARTAYGRVQYLVVPSIGYGQQWVVAGRVRILATQFPDPADVSDAK